MMMIIRPFTASVQTSSPNWKFYLWYFCCLLIATLLYVYARDPWVDNNINDSSSFVIFQFFVSYLIIIFLISNIRLRNRYNTMILFLTSIRFHQFFFLDTKMRNMNLQRPSIYFIFVIFGIQKLCHANNSNADVVWSDTLMVFDGHIYLYENTNYSHWNFFSIIS